MELDRGGAPDVIVDMDEVRGGDADCPVQLVWRKDERPLIRAINEGGFACTEVDLFDLLAWLHRHCPTGIDLEAISRHLSAFATRLREREEP